MSYAALVIFLVFGSQALAEPFWLAHDGEPAAKIYVAGPLVEHPFSRVGMSGIPLDIDRQALARSAAAEDLRYHIHQISGAKLQVVVAESVDDIERPAIVIGALANELGAKPKHETPSDETFRIVTRDQMLLIGGESDIASRHGVYTLLNHLGCDWVMPGKLGEVMPKRSTIAIDPLDLEDGPDFEFRALILRGYPDKTDADVQRFQQWNWRQRGGDSFSHPMVAAAAHSWDVLISENQELFDKNPEMLALVRQNDGSLKREGPQIESTDPRVVDLFVQQISDAYRENIEAGRWTVQTEAGFSVGPADGLGYSISPESLVAGSGRIDPVVGELDRTDETVLLANRVLEQVNKTYPNAKVGYYTYSVHADYPVCYRPNSNLVQSLAPISYSRYHSFFDRNSKTQALYRQILEAWTTLSRQQGNVIWYRGYDWNLAENLMPYTKVRIWGEEIPWYAEQGIVGLHVEATKQWSVLAASDYVFMRMGWDSSQDWRVLLREFCESAYGPAAAPMEHYNLRLIEQQHGAGQEAGSYHATHLIFDRDFIADARKDFEYAKSLAESETQRRRIDAVASSVELLEMYLNYHEATLEFDFNRAKEAYHQLIEQWREVYRQNPDLVANEAPAYLDRFVGGFVDAALHFSSGRNRIVVSLPDQMKTMFDPYNQGERMGFFEPSINDDGYIETRTISTTWDAQGLAGIRDGSVWYRFEFLVDKALEDKPLGLFLGGVEDVAEVWLNGEHCGVAGPAFSTPLVFDLTPAAKPGEANLLAIRVERRGKVNEIGLGGILRPSYVFTGERIDGDTINPEINERVLPGGSIETND